MNVANVATLDIPVAMLIPLEQAFNHISQFNILVYFLYFFLNVFSLAINPHLLAWTTSDDTESVDSQAELMGLVDIIYSPSFLINE